MHPTFCAPNDVSKETWCQVINEHSIFSGESSRVSKMGTANNYVIAQLDDKSSRTI